MQQRSFLSKLQYIIGLLCVAGCLSACTTQRIENHGYYLGGIENKLTQLKPQHTTQTEAQTILGSASLSYPSIQGTGNIWIYINYQVQTYLFKAPTVIKRQMFKLEFNNQGILQAVGPIQDLPLE